MHYKQFSPGPPDYQEVLNGLPARDCPDLKKIPVRARLVWERDGEEWKGGDALRLDVSAPAIFVEFVDRRCKFTGVWLHPDDVVWEGKSV